MVGSVVLRALNDKGLSVRKRVVKILRDICVNWHASHPRYAEIVTKLLTKFRDEESIKNEVEKCFCEMWFSEENPAIAGRIGTVRPRARAAVLANHS